VEDVSSRVMDLSEKADSSFHEIVKESYEINDLIRDVTEGKQRTKYECSTN